PLIGVLSNPKRLTRPVILVASVPLLLALVLFVRAGIAAAVPPPVASQLILAAAAVALVSAGMCFRAIFHDRLDAAACSLALSLALTLGVIAAGPAAGEIPTASLNFLLGINPLVAAMSAANFDIFRSEPLYRLSPIAHRQFSYPVWSWSAGVFVVMAATGGGAAARLHHLQRGTL
ncbi:MAG TPA: hypothetical protein VN628_17755, partial [Vicinamibacterales bacterium]|nr:hypothetical protein [Vicinamibacterales bacterium]